MKKILIILTLFFSVKSYSQKVNLELHDMAAGQKYYAYLLANNEIIAMVENENCNSFFLTTNNGTIIQDSTNKCKYVFRPTSFGIATIMYNKISKNDTVKFEERKIYVRPWPFIATVNGKSESFEMDKHRLLDSYVTIESKNTGLSAKLRMKSFKLMIKRGLVIIYNKDFNRYDSQVVELIKKDLAQLTIGDIVIYSDIVYDYYGFDLESKDINITIK